jgi:hypothetical protein
MPGPTRERVKRASTYFFAEFLDFSPNFFKIYFRPWW